MALSSLMQNKGHIVATDINGRRLNRARVRFLRNGCNNIERVWLTEDNEQPFFESKKKWFDRVLVDSPCSGTGAWRRNPENKWKADVAASLDRLIEVQDKLLRRAALVTTEGGRIIYATCSLLHAENEARVEKFLAEEEGSEFQILPAKEVWDKVISTATWPCESQQDFLKLSPGSHQTDGFFAAILERKT